MPRKRMIDPDIWVNEQFNRVSILARLLYIGLISNADDEGRFKASPQFLKMAIFPADPLTQEEILSARKELEQVRLIRIYTNTDREYGYHPNWRKYQWLNRPRPSKLPVPPVCEESVSGTVTVCDKIHRIERNRIERNRIEKDISSSNEKEIALTNEILNERERKFFERIRASPFFKTIKDPIGFIKAEIKAFPEVNFEEEMDKAEAWLIANPKKQKKNYRRFLNAWFNRAKPQRTGKQLTDEDV